MIWRKATKQFFRRPLAVIGLFIGVMVLVAILPAAGPYDPTTGLHGHPPSPQPYLLGTDEVGRDLLRGSSATYALPSRPGCWRCS